MSPLGRRFAFEKKDLSKHDGHVGAVRDDMADALWEIWRAMN
jgi:hypothetical protein